ncbi:MAG: pantoate--beta-alanine ligase [Firmicutes bacterium]|nr:pantoate--beta-alanine ligase [Bacillota bacterium]
MKVVNTVADVRLNVAAARAAGKIVGFVPTMGYFHDGHLTLMRRARERCGFVVVSLFVNPLQFGPSEDFSHYPRDPERDSRLAESTGIDVLFIPSTEEMYPEGFKTHVEVGEITGVLCGRSRPGHFRGVATVVTKLFNIVQPDVAFFGEKDYQQVVVVTQMVRDLNMPLDIVPVPTVREPDGLAMSSRNVYLSPEERRAALVLNRSLRQALEMARSGERVARRLRDLVAHSIAREPLARIDYVEIRHPVTLKEIEDLGDGAVLAVAVYFGKTRLIDNVALPPLRG